MGRKGVCDVTRFEALNILGLGENFTEGELKSVYRMMAKKYHPDLRGDVTMFRLVNEAYKFLKSGGGTQDFKMSITYEDLFKIVKIQG